MGLARKNEGCRALETDANQILIGLVRKVTLSPKQNGVVGGLHLPFNLSQGGKDGVCCQKSRESRSRQAPTCLWSPMPLIHIWEHGGSRRGWEGVSLG